MEKKILVKVAYQPTRLVERLVNAEKNMVTPHLPDAYHKVTINFAYQMFFTSIYLIYSYLFLKIIW